jgi:hypothetical protein
MDKNKDIGLNECRHFCTLANDALDCHHSKYAGVP